MKCNTGPVNRKCIYTLHYNNDNCDKREERSDMN